MSSMVMEGLDVTEGAAVAVTEDDDAEEGLWLRRISVCMFVCLHEVRNLNKYKCIYDKIAI